MTSETSHHGTVSDLCLFAVGVRNKAPEVPGKQYVIHHPERKEYTFTRNIGEASLFKKESLDEVKKTVGIFCLPGSILFHDEVIMEFHHHKA